MIGCYIHAAIHFSVILMCALVLIRVEIIGASLN
jgi:hypothetical protein